MPTYITRSLEPVVQRAVSEFPAIVLTGPRQSGKTTLLTHLFGDKYGYASLEPPDVRAVAAEDPRSFLAAHPPPVILDEVQYVPELLPYVKERIDEHRDEPGQYLLTGSQNLLLLDRVTESLAGRAAILRLLPLSRREAVGDPLKPFPWEQTVESKPSDAGYGDVWREFLRGYYPELVANPDRDVSLWHSAYVQTYLERDVRSIRQVGDLTQFQTFLRALAARSAQLLSLSELARDIGVAVNTAKAWLSVLEASYQVVVLRPYHTNIGKRLVKTPKVFFLDVGTLAFLTGLRDPEHAASGPLGGALMETAVLAEVVKGITHRGEDPRVYFWRTSAGAEVDIVVEVSGKLLPLEVKLSASPRTAMATSIRVLQDDLADSVMDGYVVHPGSVRIPLGATVTALPLTGL